MSNDNVFEFKNPGVSTAVRDTLTDVLREGARELLAQAIEAEVNTSRTALATPGFLNSNTLSLLTAYSLLVKRLIDDSGRTIKNTPPLISVHTQLSIIAPILFFQDHGHTPTR